MREHVREPSLDEGSLLQDGLRSSRRSVLALGPFLALVPPLLALLAAVALWALWPCSGTGCVPSGATGFLLAGLALPTALVLGLPWQGGTVRYLAVVATSALLWMVLGGWAARRAARHVITGWREWWREYRWLLAGVWAGTLVAVVVLVLVAGGQALV
jgi:hypothetical protein